ncbi:MAG: hypothetical protein RLZZ17_124, partial [Actinomycetota bacterium]
MVYDKKAQSPIYAVMIETFTRSPVVYDP